MKQNSGNFFRVNDQIQASQVRVIDAEGEMVGVMDLAKAIVLAETAGFDLVEVSPNVSPPVCKIADYGKMKYEMRKKVNDSKKKQKVIETKEIKMSINIGQSDFNFKINHAIKFIEKGDKVKVSIRLKGREMTHLELAEHIMANVAQKLEEYAKFESGPKMEGRQMVGILVKK
ncbi:MAG: translation initiation factor IF-3 [Proteobacteria bacterium]|nr:translation initiation factor IF-3 [Pseudomonadota bacterium]